jgi:hypothetical protein
MIDDFRPAPRPAKSLHAALDARRKVRKPKPEAEPFHTPDEVAAAQTLQAPVEAPETQIETVEQLAPEAVAPETPESRPTKSSWRQKLALSWPPHKKEYIVVAVVIVVLAGAGGAAWALTHQTKKVLVAVHKVAAVKQITIVKPTTVASTLSGLQVDPSVNSRPVTAVMIENSDNARPQSGLSAASVVFEAIAEGGVTRFMALYQDTQPTNLGPVRSARPYYLQWALGFDADYAHVGGSPDALADIKSWDVKDLDEFYNGDSYHRISTREAPHNVYTSIATLNQLETSKGYTTSTYTGFTRKTEAPLKVPTAATINLTLSGPDFNAHYDYSSTTNSYNRSEGGAALVDANTNLQLSPKVVIAMVTPETQGALDSSGAYYSDYQVIGSGAAYIFQDGGVTTGQWSKGSSTTQIVFTDSSGATIKLNPGQTWLTAVTTTSDVNYTP